MRASTALSSCIRESSNGGRRPPTLRTQPVTDAGAPSSRTCCFIVPPDLLNHIAAEGSDEEREAALRTIAASASTRTRRAVIARLIRESGVDAASIFMRAPAGKRRRVYDADHRGRSSLPGNLVRSENEDPVPDQAVNQAFDGSGTTYDLFKDVYRRESLDDRGLELVSSVHFGVGFDNAFWDGTQMVYGEGSGRIFQIGAFTKAIDVIGHELTHGVIDFSAGLIYSKDSGALNESFSDVFGSIVKQYARKQTVERADWLIGEASLLPQLGTALRSMKEPGSAFQGDRQPGHMDHYVDLPDDNDPDNDNGGVHINSGIPNRAFYLAATEIGGNSWEVSGKIWYETLTQELKPNSQFPDAARATIEVAGRLFGSGGSEEDAVRTAWQAVGVLT